MCRFGGENLSENREKNITASNLIIIVAKIKILVLLTFYIFYETFVPIFFLCENASIQRTEKITVEVHIPHIYHKCFFKCT